MGALTQGDRRATGQSSALGLGTFDMDNKFGKAALKEMVKSVWDCSTTNLVEDVSDKHFFEGLEVIDRHLGEVLEDTQNGVSYDIRCH